MHNKKKIVICIVISVLIILAMGIMIYNKKNNEFNLNIDKEKVTSIQVYNAIELESEVTEQTDIDKIINFASTIKARKINTDEIRAGHGYILIFKYSNGKEYSLTLQSNNVYTGENYYSTDINYCNVFSDIYSKLNVKYIK